jgi:hypothetical protein
MISAFAALFLELAAKDIFFAENDMSLNEIISRLSPLIIIAIIIEESLKILFILPIVREIADRRKIFLMSFLIGLGFASVEIAFNISDIDFQVKPIYLELLGLILLHALTAGFAGFGLAKSRSLNIIKLLGILFITSLLHLIYNTAVIYENEEFLFFYLPALVIILILILTSYRYKQDPD